MLEKDKKWKNQTNKKIPFMAERQCIVFGAKNVWNQKDNAILSSNPAVISSSCNICHPLIVMQYIWNISENICMKLNSVQHNCPPSQTSVPQFLLNTCSYIYLRPLYILMVYIFWDIYFIMCVIYTSLFCQADIVNTPQVWNTALFCLRCEETF